MWRSTAGTLPNFRPIIIAWVGSCFSTGSDSACIRTGQAYSSARAATAPTWSMWAWVTIMDPTSRSVCSTASAMRAASSPFDEHVLELDAEPAVQRYPLELILEDDGWIPKQGDQGKRVPSRLVFGD